jgi:hypothetical protein
MSTGGLRPIEDIQEFPRMSAAKRKAVFRQTGQVIQVASRTFPYFTLVSTVQDRVDESRPAQLDHKFSDFHLNANCISKRHNILTSVVQVNKLSAYFTHQPIEGGCMFDFATRLSLASFTDR